MAALSSGSCPSLGAQTQHWFEPSKFLQQFSQVSPDGRWVTYASNESGRYEIYVQSFPMPGGGKWQISNDGGMYPRWRRDGRELFYYALDGALMAVPLGNGARLDVGTAVPLFQARLLNGPAPGPRFRQQYDVARDGQRFLLNMPLEDAAASSITVVLNWEAGLKK